MPSTYLNAFLIGQRGDTVRSLQFLVMSALKTRATATRVNVDVADYKSSARTACVKSRGMGKKKVRDPEGGFAANERR